jgi:hypothetical protein
MNERVKELAEQCQEYRNGFEGQEAWYTVFNKQKFAELIVQKCLTIANKAHKMALEFEWDNDDTAQTIKDSIKEHFGVK